jgi:hypothetical protein
VSRGFHLDLGPFLSAYGKQVTAQVSDECINSFAGSYNGLTIQQLLQPQYQDFLANPTFATIVNHLIMGTAPGHPTEPLFMAVGNHDGTGDGVMVAADVEALAHEYCQQGVPVTFSEYRNLDHTQAAAPFESTALAFLEARFAGAPPPNGCASIGAGNSLAPLPVSAAGTSSRHACPLVSGRLSGDTLGRARLGMTRRAARRAYTHSSTRGRRYEDFFCLTPVGVRVGYGSPKLLRQLPRRQRTKFANRVVWASTSDIYFALHMVRPQTEVRAARRLLRLSRPFHVGRNDWYLARNGRSTAVLKVRHGRVEEIGIADRWLTRNRRIDRAFLRSFS